MNNYNYNIQNRYNYPQQPTNTGYFQTQQENNPNAFQVIDSNQQYNQYNQLLLNNNALNEDNTMLNNQIRLLYQENNNLKSILARYRNSANEIVRQFHCNLITGIYYTLEPNGYKTKPIGKFIIHSMQIVLKKIDYSTEKYLLICYEGNNPTNRYYTLIPIQDLENKKLLKHFSYAEFSTNCSHSILEEFLFTIITKQEVNGNIYIPKYAGFYLKDTEIISFYANQQENIRNEIYNILPNTIKSKNLNLVFNKEDIPQIKKMFEDTHKNISITEGILYLYRVSGILSSILYTLNIEFKQILVITSDKPVDKYIFSRLQVFNRPNLTGISLDSSKKTIIDTLATSNDETVILSDCTIIDDDKKRQASLDILYKNLLHMDNCDTKHNIAIISNKAPYILQSNSMFCLNVLDSFNESQLKSYSQILEYQDAFIIDYVCTNFKSIQFKLKEYFDNYKSTITSLCEESKTTYAILMSILRLVLKIFDANITNLKVFEENIIDLLQNSSNNYNNNEFAIVNEFNKVLNNKIRKEIITIIPFSKNMKFSSNTNEAILKSDLILLEEITIKNTILKDMNLTNKFSTLLRALQKNSLLVCTKDNRYTTTIYDEDGYSKRIDLVALKYQEIIDLDVQYIIDDSTTKEYFQTQEPDCICIPLLTNHAGNTAYQEIDFQAKANRHIFVTGKSGSGKTVAISQIIASLRNLDEKIVIFDSSDSFTKEELTRNLSEDFINNYVAFYNLEIEKLPINPFLFNDTLRKTEIKNRITSILSASFADLTQNQINTLKQAVFETLKKDENSFDIYSLIDTLSSDNGDGNGRVKKIICNKLMPLVEDIIEKEPINQTWYDFIENSNDIIILSMANNSNFSGNKLIDLLLASLFIYQRENADRHLNIVIDEIQSQNLASNGPITKVLKEGRKYQMSLLYATQTISKSSGEKAKILKQAGTSIYFKPDITSIDSIAEFLHLNNRDKYKLDELKVGQCFIQGDIYNSSLDMNVQTVIKGNIYTHYNNFNNR